MRVKTFRSVAFATLLFTLYAGDGIASFRKERKDDFSNRRRLETNYRYQIRCGDSVWCFRPAGHDF
jgi:hypothetical protein